MSAQAAKVLRDAAGVIAQRGHHKGQFCSTDADGTVGAVCLWGGVNAALSGDANNYVSDIFEGPTATDRAEYARRRNVRSEIYDGLSALFRTDVAFPGAVFNDLPETTSEDVQKVLLKVADDIEFK